MLAKRSTKMKHNKPKLELPYKQTPSARPVIENVEAATFKFCGSDKNATTGKYEMILIAANRGRDLANGADSFIDSKYKPAVTALLEIEAGFVGRDYVSVIDKK